jgi:hypothetical protein
LLYPAELRAQIVILIVFSTVEVMPGMKWKTTKIDNLLRDETSGRYYARFWRDSKQKWISLKTDVFTVAKIRIARNVRRSIELRRLCET